MWIKPKTNWIVKYDRDGTYLGDYFNLADYDRIKNNILELLELSKELYPLFELTPFDQLRTGDLFYITSMNKIESNLSLLNSKTLKLPYDKKNWVDHKEFITFADLNRIELLIQNLYEYLESSNNRLPRLPYKLGRKKRGGVRANIR